MTELKHSAIRAAAALCLLFMFTAAADAQVLYGSIVGNVLDPSRSAVPNATITVTSLKIGQSLSGSTDERGFYAFRLLQEGVYDLKVSAPGFLTFSRNAIAITINTVNRVDVDLVVGSVSESVTVSGQSTTLQTDKADVHTDFQSVQLINLPLTGYRNYQTLLDLVPGATPSRFQNTLIATPGRALTTNINGTNRFTNTTRVDGAPNVDPWLPSHTLSVQPAEAIETVNISTNSFDAEEGIAGGAAVNVTTKSGTNELHGVAFHYHNNNAMAAKNFFFLQPRRPKNIQNQYGGTLGGPIRRNKLFYFGSFEGMSQRQSFSATPTVVTADQREGNFGATGVTLYDPLTGTPDGRGRTMFPDARIPLSRQSAIARKMQSFVPLPNQPGFTNNYFVSAPLVFDRYNYDVKVNWNPSSRTAVWGKYGAMDALVEAQPMLGEGGGAGLGGGAAGSSDTLVQMAGIGLTHTVSPTFLLDGNIGFARRGQAQKIPLLGTNFGLEVLGIPGTNGPDVRQSGQPNFAVTGYQNFGNPDLSKPAFFNENLFSYTFNAGWTKGSHTMRFGFALDRRAMNHWQPEISGGPRGTFTFTGGSTSLSGGAAPRQFNAYADYLLGLPQAVNKSLQYIAPMTTREWFQGYYFRDQWQATRSLTVSLGLRWEYFPMMTRDHFGIQRYDMDINKVFLGRVGSVPDTAGSGVSKKLFAPRVGLAWRVGTDTVVRTGYGISIDPNPMSRALRSPYPVVVGQDLRGTNTFTQARRLEEGIPPFPVIEFGDGIIDIPGTVATVTIPKGLFERGYYQSFNLTIERRLPWGFSGQAGYVATRGVRPAASLHLNAGMIPGAGAAGQPLNVLFRRTADTTISAPTGTTNYNSLQARLDRRFSGGLLLNLSYTWSKSIDWCSDGNCGLMFNIPGAQRRNRAVSSFDRRHNLTTAGVWELPLGRGKRWLNEKALSRMVASGWQINGILRCYTGLPFTISAPATSLNAPNNSQVADQVAPTSSKLGGIGRGQLFFDTSAFRAVTEPRFGTSGRNSMWGPGFIGVDLGLFRAFAFTERYQLQFRAEASNATNTPHFNNPASAVNSSDFGFVTSAMDDQRVVRLALRLSF